MGGVAPAQLVRAVIHGLDPDAAADAHGAHGRFGTERLAAVLEMLVGLPPAQIVDRVDRALAAYRSGDPTDDSAIVAFRRCP